MAKGSTVGSIIGAVAGGVGGAVIGGPAGAAAGIGAGENLGGTVGSLFDANTASKINPVAPSAVDPQEAVFNSELASLRANRNTGVAYREATRQLRISEANAMKNATNAAGGSSGALIAANTALNNTFGDEYGKVFSAGQREGDVENNDYINSLNSMVNRRKQLDYMRYGQDLYNKTSGVQEGNSNAMAGLAHIDQVGQLLAAYLKKSTSASPAATLTSVTNTSAPTQLGNSIPDSGQIQPLDDFWMSDSDRDLGSQAAGIIGGTN